MARAETVTQILEEGSLSLAEFLHPDAYAFELPKSSIFLALCRAAVETVPEKPTKSRRGGEKIFGQNLQP